MTRAIDPSAADRSTHVWGTAGLVFIVGLVIGLVGVTERTLWLDESATVIAATRSWSGLATLTGEIDLVHALYYAVLHVWFGVVGYSPVSLRAPSAVAIAATAALLVPLGRRLLSYRLGVLAAAVFLATPAALLAATNGRSQSFEMLAAVAATLLLVTAARTTAPGSRSRLVAAWAGYSLVAFIGVLFNLWFVFVVIAHALTVLVLAARRRESRIQLLGGAVTSMLVVAVATVPFAVGAVAQSSQIGFLQRPSARSAVLTVFRDQSFALPLVHTGTTWPLLLAGGSWLLAIIGAIWLVRIRPGVLSVVVPWLFVTPVGLLAVTIIASPTFSDRYLAMCVPALSLLVAAGVMALTYRFRAVLAVVAGLALLVFGAHAWQLVRWGDPATVDWRTAATEIEQERSATSGRAGIIYGAMARPPLQLAVDYPDELEHVSDLTKTPPAPSTGFWAKSRSVGDAVARTDGYAVVWYVGEPASPEVPAVTSAMRGKGFIAEETTLFDGGILLEYRRID
ncbi:MULTISPECIES: glycosyltransferase family 39 protein [unclassified Curtobacterium]|uniref:glycosyltransferase family 39 protein n=1 Tax=unclassified Curtobacterium TaxID=257496 RepID=UPI0015E88414|nr:MULTISPECIES: glycosyltransferase family 39 protein [unclassified Curtobacterium]